MPRPRTSPIRNPVLAAAIAATGRTYASIAATINQVGDENGHDLRCTAATLGKWLNGTVPQPTLMAAAAEAFSRLLNSPGPADLGWPAAARTSGSVEHLLPGNPWRGDPVSWITTLGRDDMLNRRTAMTIGLYSVAAAAVPAHPEQVSSRTGSARRAGAGDVERIRATTHAFEQLDDLYGGGHARAAVAAYLTSDVAPLLHGTTGRARPDLFLAAAELAYLLGWMSADDLKAGLAQRYYVQAGRLAEEAGDPLMRATALRSLAVQAIELGHHRAGNALAQSAFDGIGTRATARRRAWITGMCAEALAASDHDRRRAHALLHKAETDLERADSLPEHEWTGNYRRESYEHQVGLTLTQLGDHGGAEQHYAASVGSRRTVERRTRALIGARLADAQLRQRRPDEAAHTIRSLSDDLTAAASPRVRRVLDQVRTGWAPLRDHPAISEADRLLASLPRPAAAH